jgi:hypothetical protein|nr:MAG TPA_asm: Tape measure domain protein [Caudoviricetes sp.]
MAEDIDGALGIRATIDADDIKTSAQQWVDTITSMQSKTNEVVQGMNYNLSSLQKEIDEFGKTANGMSLSELASQLDNSKAAFVSLGDDIKQQKNIIKETTADLGDLQRAYKEAKNEGNTSASDEILKQIENYKEGLAAQRRELNSMIAQQQAEKDKITELTQAYKELQSSQPTFKNVVAGATSATERIENLRQSFQTFQETLTSSQSAINGLSQESANAMASGDSGMQDVVNTITTRYIIEGSDEVQAKNEAVATTMKDVEAAYSSAAATAQTAFNEQKNVIQALETQISNLQTIMQEAVKAGDMSSASEIAAQIQTLEAALVNAKNKLVELQAQTEQANQNLLEFGRVNSEVSQRLDSQSSVWGRVKEQIKSLGKGALDSLGKQFESAKGVVSTFTSTIDGMGIPLSNSITKMKELTIASMKFIATPVGAVLGAIAIALKSVWTFLHKSAEGQMLMAKGGAFFGSIMGSVTKLLVAFGKALFKVFTSGDPIIRQFTSNLVTTFKLAFTTLKDMVFGFGNLLQGVFTGNWEQMKKGAEMLGKSFVDNVKLQISAVKTLVTGTAAAFQTMNKLITDKELTGELSSIINNMGKNAVKAYKLEAQNLSLKKEEREVNERNAQLEDTIAEKYNEIYKLTGKAKDAKIEEVKALKQQLYYGKTLANGKHEAGLLDIAKKKLAITKEQNKLHSRTLQDVAKESELQIGVYKTMAAAHSSVRMLTRLQESNRRKMASAASSSAKSATKTGNAVSSGEDKLSTLEAQNILSRAELYKSLEDKITDARIQAMRDGYERTKEERDRQNTKELEDIENQRIKAVEAEKKRQKAEFDAQQAIVKAKGGKIKKWDETKDLNQEPINYINKQFEQLNQITQQKQQRQAIDSLAQVYDKTEQERIDKVNKLKADIQTLEQELQKNTDETSKNEIEKLRQNAQAQLDWVSQSKDAWNEYYQKYGTFLEKRAALEEKFLHDTQGMDKDSPEYKAKYEEYKLNKSSLSTSELKSNIDWGSVFSDIGMMSSKMAKIQLANLQAYTQTDEYKGLDANDKQVISEAIDKLEKEAGAHLIGAFKNFGKSVNDYKKQLETLSTLQDNEMQAQNALIEAKNIEAQKTKEVAEAQEKLKQATESGREADIQAAQKNLEAAQKNLKSAEKNSEKAKKAADDSSNAVKAQTDITKQSREDVKKQGKNLTSSFDTITSVFQNLKSGSLSGTFNSIVSLVDAFKHVKEASNKTAKQQEKDAQSNSVSAGQTEQAQKETSKAIAATGQALQAIPNVWTQAIGAILSVLDILGDDLEGGIGNLAGTLLEKVGNIAETSLSQIGNGKFFADIGKGVWNLVGGIGRGFGDAFGIRDNWNSYRKAYKQYEKLDKVWTSLISKKKEYLSLSYGDEAKKVGKDYVELAKADLEATKAIANKYLGSWKKGSHSAGYKFNEKMKDGVEGVTWSNVSNAVGVSISDISQLTYLSKEQLENLKTNYTKWWVELPEEYRNYLESIIDKQDTLEDATQDVLEKLTGVKFDDMYSNFMSCLTDMSKGADDWVSDFKDKIRKAIIDNMMGKEVKEWLEDYTKRYQAAMDKGTLTDAERQQFIDEANEKSNEFFNERKEILENIGLGKSSDSSSTGGGFATASEESVEELSGRALAANEALYSIRDIQSSHTLTYEAINDGIQQMITIEASRNEYYNESIEIQRTSVGHLATIAKNTNELYVMNERLAKIEKNTRNM